MNPRDGYPPYALSRGASSANLSKSPDEVWYYYEKCSCKRYGGEGGIRTHGSCESLVFKTSSLNHSDTSPYPLSYEYYYTTELIFVNTFLQYFITKAGAIPGSADDSDIYFIRKNRYAGVICCICSLQNLNLRVRVNCCATVDINSLPLSILLKRI